MVNVASPARLCLREVSERGRFRVERRDRFDKASDGEGIAHAAGAADKAQRAAFARQLDGNAHESGYAGAINLRNAIEVDDDPVGPSFGDSFERVVELLAGITNGQAAAHFEYRDGPGLSNVDFHGRMLGHKYFARNPHSRCCNFALPGRNCGSGQITAAMHYTMAAPVGKNGLRKNW